MGMVRGVPRTVRLLALGAFLNAVVSFTFVYSSCTSSARAV